MSNGQQRSIAFIDYGYLKRAAEKSLIKKKGESMKLRFDPSDMVRWLRDERGDFVRAYWYYSELPESYDHESRTKQARFFQAIAREESIKVRLGTIRKRNLKAYNHALFKTVESVGGDIERFKEEWKHNSAAWHQKGVDTLLSLDMYRLAVNDAFEVAHLVTGDQDMIHAVELVQFLGKRVELHAPSEKGLSPQLVAAVDTVNSIDHHHLRAIFTKARDLP